MYIVWLNCWSCPLIRIDFDRYLSNSYQSQQPPIACWSGPPGTNSLVGQFDSLSISGNSVPEHESTAPFVDRGRFITPLFTSWTWTPYRKSTRPKSTFLRRFPFKLNEFWKLTCTVKYNILWQKWLLGSRTRHDYPAQEEGDERQDWLGKHGTCCTFGCGTPASPHSRSCSHSQSHTRTFSGASARARTLPPCDCHRHAAGQSWSGQNVSDQVGPVNFERRKTSSKHTCVRLRFRKSRFFQQSQKATQIIAPQDCAKTPRCTLGTLKHWSGFSRHEYSLRARRWLQQWRWTRRTTISSRKPRRGADFWS